MKHVFSYLKRSLVTVILIAIYSSPSLYSASLNRVGVMDFSNLTGSKDHDWVAEAFSESLSRKLSKVIDLSVINRSELRKFENVRRLSHKKIQSGDAKELARLAGLHFLVFGSVQSSSSINQPKAPLRVHARLVDTRRGIIHQAVSVDGNMDQLFDLQYQLSMKFIDMAKIEISIAEMKSMRSNATLNLEAYRLYNLGLLEKKKKSYPKAIQFFEKAMAKHPGILYADAHYEIGQVYLLMGRKAELLTRFKADVAQLAPVYYDLGVAYQNAGQYEKAIEAYKTFVHASNRRPTLWELHVEDENFKLICSKETRRAIMLQKEKASAIDTHTGQVLWTKSLSAALSPQYSFHKQKLIVSQGKQHFEVNMENGNEKLLSQNELKIRLPKPKSNELDIILSDTTLEVHDKKKGELLWNYKTKQKDRILDHDGQSFFVKRGRHRLRALRIQKGHIPGQIEGLVQMGRCLESVDKTEEALEVYRYIIDHIDDEHPLASRKLKLQEKP